MKYSVLLKNIYNNSGLYMYILLFLVYILLFLVNNTFIYSELSTAKMTDKHVDKHVMINMIN